MNQTLTMSGNVWNRKLASPESATINPAAESRLVACPPHYFLSRLPVSVNEAIKLTRGNARRVNGCDS